MVSQVATSDQNAVGSCTVSDMKVSWMIPKHFFENFLSLSEMFLQGFSFVPLAYLSQFFLSVRMWCLETLFIVSSAPPNFFPVNVMAQIVLK